MVTVAVGCSVVGEAKMDTGRSCTGWASTPLGAVIRVTWVGWETGCIVIVGVVSPPAAVSVVCAADTVIAVGLITWLESVAMVPKVVIGVAREALVLCAPAPARLVETVPVTVPSVVTPVVPFTTNVVTAGLTAETVTGVTRRTPPIGTVRRMVPGCPGAPFSTTWVTPCCPWPVAILGTAVMILAGAPVPEVITLVVIIVMGDLMPGLLVTPVAPAWVIMADMGMVLMMVVVPGLVVLGETLLMPRIVGLVPAPLACVVVMMVVGLPSADVTSFRIVPAGRGPLVWMI